MEHRSCSVNDNTVRTLSKEARDRLIERQMKKGHEAHLWMEVGMWDGHLWYCGEIYLKKRKSDAKTT